MTCRVVKIETTNTVYGENVLVSIIHAYCGPQTRSCNIIRGNLPPSKQGLMLLTYLLWLLNASATGPLRKEYHATNSVYYNVKLPEGISRVYIPMRFPMLSRLSFNTYTSKVLGLTSQVIVFI